MSGKGRQCLGSKTLKIRATRCKSTCRRTGVDRFHRWTHALSTNERVEQVKNILALGIAGALLVLIPGQAAPLFRDDAARGGADVGGAPLAVCRVRFFGFG